MFGRTMRAVTHMLVTVLAFAASAEATQMPARRYGVRDGLAHEFVRALLVDSRGFLWAGTEVGVARFDGRGFKTYGMADGLPPPSSTR